MLIKFTKNLLKELLIFFVAFGFWAGCIHGALYLKENLVKAGGIGGIVSYVASTLSSSIRWHDVSDNYRKQKGEPDETSIQPMR